MDGETFAFIFAIVASAALLVMSLFYVSFQQEYFKLSSLIFLLKGKFGEN